MQQRLKEHQGFFNDAPIDLSSSATLPSGYEAGHAFGVQYNAGYIPPDDQLALDLKNIVRLYLLLTARGGMDPSIDSTYFEDEVKDKMGVLERRRYRQHQRIERNSSAAKKAKAIHGYQCQGCGFDFSKIYGETGESFIEAHHLTPLSELPEDTPVFQDPLTDFAVLCSNCHRMIHKTGSPGNLDRFCKTHNIDVIRSLFRSLK